LILGCLFSRKSVLSMSMQHADFGHISHLPFPHGRGRKISFLSELHTNSNSVPSSILSTSAYPLPIIPPRSNTTNTTCKPASAGVSRNRATRYLDHNTALSRPCGECCKVGIRPAVCTRAPSGAVRVFARAEDERHNRAFA